MTHSDDADKSCLHFAGNPSDHRNRNPIEIAVVDAEQLKSAGLAAAAVVVGAVVAVVCNLMMQSMMDDRPHRSTRRPSSDQNRLVDCT